MKKVLAVTCVNMETNKKIRRDDLLFKCSRYYEKIKNKDKKES